MRRALLASVVMVLSSCSFVYYPLMNGSVTEPKAELEPGELSTMEGYPQCSVARLPYILDTVGLSAVGGWTVGTMLLAAIFGNIVGAVNGEDYDEIDGTIAIGLAGGAGMAAFGLSAYYGKQRSSGCRKHRHAYHEAKVARPVATSPAPPTTIPDLSPATPAPSPQPAPLPPAPSPPP